MKAYLVIVFLAAAFYSVQAQQDQSEYKVFYHSNGQIASEGKLVNGQPDGYWKTYYENGSIKSEGNRVDFLLDSLWKFYNEENVLSLEINYRKGKKNGERITYLPDEIVRENFEDDIKNGWTKFFDLQGRLKRKVPFINGL